MSLLAIPDVQVHPLTRSDLVRMVDAGILAEDARVELLDGTLVEMTPISPEHMNAVNWLNMHFARAAQGWVVSIQNALSIRGDERSLPQPDVALLPADRDSRALPDAALLVIEVAVTSQRLDREIKAAKYALTGVPEYWIFDVTAGRVEVRREPVGGEYRELRIYGAGETITPLVAAAPAVAVDELVAATLG